MAEIKKTKKPITSTEADYSLEPLAEEEAHKEQEPEQLIEAEAPTEQEIEEEIVTSNLKCYVCFLYVRHKSILK
jgi:hypothetical protein